MMKQIVIALHEVLDRLSGGGPQPGFLQTKREQLNLEIQPLGKAQCILAKDLKGNVRAARWAYKVSGGYVVGQLVRWHPDLNRPIPEMLVPMVSMAQVEKAGWLPLNPHDKARTLDLAKEWTIRAGVSAMLKGAKL